MIADAAFLEKLNISASTGSRNSGDAGNAPAAEAPKEEKKVEKTQFELYLKSFDAKSKLNLIKEIRTILGLGLKEVRSEGEGACRERAVVSQRWPQAARARRTSGEARGARVRSRNQIINV